MINSLTRRACALSATIFLIAGSLFTAAAKGNDLADAVEAASLYVSRIELRDNTLIPASVLEEHFAPYRNRHVDATALVELAQQLTTYLVDQGYVSSGVVLPDQNVDDGVVYLQLVPGRLEAVHLEGQGRLRDSYLRARLPLTPGEVFNVNAAAAQLRLLQQDPRVATVDAAVRPGTQQGQTILYLDVEEADAFTWRIGSDNHVSPNVGAVQQYASLVHTNLSGRGDSLSLGLARAEGLDEARLAYDVPVTHKDTRFGFRYDRSETAVVVEPFDQLDIEGESTRFGLHLEHPFYRTVGEEIVLGVGLQHQRVESFLLGEPFAFAANSADGEIRATLLTLSQQWLRRDAERVLALHSNIDIGLDQFDASVGFAGDSRFVAWYLQGQWLQRLALWDGTLALTGQLRLANDSLPGALKFALGGVNTVRGYRQNLVTRDNAAAWSAAYRIPVTLFDSSASIAPFFDYGFGWDNDPSTAEDRTLYSAGLEWQWRIASSLDISLQYAAALKDEPVAPGVERNLQDDGWHFSISLGF